jgi:Carboxypeptidase regulatory-like domain/TonB dependent receptor-like, beta-barrel
MNEVLNMNLRPKGCELMKSSESVIKLAGRSNVSKEAWSILGAMFGMLLLCLPAFSQGSAGRIQGAVTDQSGGAVAGATVTVTDTQRGTSRTLTTDEAGGYNAPSLTPGTYKVRAEAKGFKIVDRENVLLEVNGDLRIDLKLQPGDVSQTITVTEEVPLVETTNAELGGTIQNTIIENLPLNGRNFENLLTLRPGVEIYVGGGGWTQSTNGVRPHDNVYLVEGVNSNDPWMAQSIMNAAMAAGDAGTILPVDAIDEFKTQVNPKAEYGWKPGAVVSVGIKSGTNSYHGTAYAYGRSDSFDARNYFNTAPNPVAPLSLQQFGATFGGPVKKDKLFFFTTFEEQRYSVGATASHTVPATAHMPAPSPATCANNPALGDCANSLVDACNDTIGHGITNLSAQLAGLDPATCLPVSGQPAGGFQGLFPVSADGSLTTNLVNTNRVDSGLAKVDYHLNDKNTLSGMYFISPGNGILADGPTRQVSTQILTNQYARSQVGSVGWTWTPSSNWVNEARVGYSHYYQVFQSQDHNQDPANYNFTGNGSTTLGTYHIYTGQTNPDYFGLPRIRFASFGRFELGAQWPKTVGPDSVTQIQDHVSYLHGKHAFKFGGEILVNQSTSNVTSNTKGPVEFNTLEDFLTGTPLANQSNTAFLTGNLLRHMSYNGYAVFLQDDWRIKPTLMVNLGLRYEITTVMKERDGLIGNFDPTSATGLSQVGFGFTSPFNGDHNNFSPRLGIAWDVRGDGKTVIRAGGSIVYEQISLDAFNGQGNFLGLRMIPSGAQLFTNGDGTTFTQGKGTINVVATPGLATGVNNWAVNSPTKVLYFQAPKCGTGLGGDPSPCNILGVDRNLRTPYVSTWTFGIQRAITNNISLEVAYVGNHGTKLLGLTNINQPGYHGVTVPANGTTILTPFTATVGAGWTGQALSDCAGGGSCSPNGNLERLAQPFTSSCPSALGVGTGTGTGKCFPYLQYIEFFSNHDKSNYNGLQVTLTQRTSHGLSFTAGYTYAHALDDNGDNEGNGLHTPINNYNPGALYGNSDFDIRHRFTLSVNYAIPGKKGFGQALEGWAVNSIVTIQTGSVWGVNDQTHDLSGTGSSGDPVGSIGEQWVFSGPPSGFTPVHGWTDSNGGGGGVPFFPGGGGTTAPTANAACNAKAASLGPLAIASLNNLGCYAVGNSILVPQAYGSLGTTGRNIFRDQGFKNLDMSVTKQFKFKERLSAEFKAELFNVLNHPNFANPYGGPGGAAADPSNGGYGFTGATPDVQASNSVLGSGGARAMQLGMKVTF